MVRAMMRGIPDATGDHGAVWNINCCITVPNIYKMPIISTLHISTRRITQPLNGSQNHVPAAYCIWRKMMSLSEIASLAAWCTDLTKPVPAPSSHLGEPVVYELRSRSAALERQFAGLCTRLHKLKDAVGAVLGLPEEELADLAVHDIRLVTYRRGDESAWQCMDPLSHFGITIMLSRQGKDYEGGTCSVRPGSTHTPGYNGTPCRLGQGDMILYTSAKVEHAVSTVISGVLQMCLVGLRRRSASVNTEVCPRPLPRGPTLPADTTFSIAVINLATRPDRLAKVSAQLAHQGMEAVRLEAVTGAGASEDVVGRVWDSTLNSRYDTKTVPARLRLSDGERGCAASHVMLWAVTAERRDDDLPTLILEDDVVLCEHFKSRCSSIVTDINLTIPPSERFLLVYVGGEVAAWRADDAFARVDGTLLREAEYVWQTSSYLIYPAAARWLMQQLPVDCPVDNFLSKQFLAGGMRALIAVPALAWQAAAYSQGDIVHTNVYKPVHVQQQPLPSATAYDPRLYHARYSTK